MPSTLPIFAVALAIAAPALADGQLVPLPAFTAVQLHGGGEITIVPGPVQRVTILAGSTQFTSLKMRRGEQLDIHACNARCPRNYNPHIRIETPTVPSVAVDSGGMITVERGFRPQREIVAAVSEGGTVDLRALDANEAVAAVDRGGEIFVRPRAALTAAISNGGDVHYSGNPSVTQAIQGGGDVRRDR